jgi:hypothetical protein
MRLYSTLRMLAKIVQIYPGTVAVAVLLMMILKTGYGCQCVESSEFLGNFPRSERFREDLLDWRDPPGVNSGSTHSDLLMKPLISIRCIP